MKYIVVDNGAWFDAYIFSQTVEHAALTSNIHGKVISAGFVAFTPTGLECYGESVSLKVKARPEIDSKLINKMLGAPDD